MHTLVLNIYKHKMCFVLSFSLLILHNIFYVAITLYLMYGSACFCKVAPEEFVVLAVPKMYMLYVIWC